MQYIIIIEISITIVVVLSYLSAYACNLSNKKKNHVV